MLLYLIRHGESTYNAQGRIQGQSDPELSERGRRQGEAVARRLGVLPIRAVYSSPLRRASQTAEPLASALRLEVRFDRRLMEVDAGEFENQMRDDVMRRYPDAIPQWRSGDLEFAFPGGESRRQLVQRGREALLSIASNGHASAAIVSHGGLLLAAMKALLGIASEAAPLGMENGSVTQLRIEGDGRAELIEFNSIEHLAGIESPSDG